MQFTNSRTESYLLSKNCEVFRIIVTFKLAYACIVMHAIWQHYTYSILLSIPTPRVVNYYSCMQTYQEGVVTLKLYCRGHCTWRVLNVFTMP